MPEGDSVFRLAARLRPALVGRTVAAGELRGGSAAGRSLAGRGIRDIDTHGKHLLIRFDDGDTLHSHLLMQGSWTITAPGRSLPRTVLPDVRVRLRLDDGSTAWGVEVPILDLLRTRDEGEVVGHLGPDPLREDWDADAAIRRIRAMGDRPAVAALLDQRGMSGLGNLWVNELCFLRGIWPWTPVSGIRLEPLVALAARALRHSATHADAYQVTTGTTRRGERHWVSGRAGRPCLRCGTVVLVRDEVRADPEQRRTWWCPRCQPEPEPAPA
jgi:endonuclease-8